MRNRVSLIKEGEGQTFFIRDQLIHHSNILLTFYCVYCLLNKYHLRIIYQGLIILDTGKLFSNNCRHMPCMQHKLHSLNQQLLNF